jgi:hypothetical protein
MSSIASNESSGQEGCQSSNRSWITTDGYLNAVQSRRITYCKADFLFSAGWWRGQLEPSYQKNAQVLVIGHSDNELTDEVVSRLKHPGLKRIFAVNATSTDPLVTPLPLGLTNNTQESDRHPVYGNTDILHKVLQSTPEPCSKTNLVYMNFDVGTFPLERQPVHDLFAPQDWVTVGSPLATLDARETFLRAMRTHSFVLCPRGNGLDTHRLWEALYMGAIPIVHDPQGALRTFHDLPILFVNEWSDVTKEFLAEQEPLIRAKVWNAGRLTLEWWTNEILTAALTE